MVKTDLFSLAMIPKYLSSYIDELSDKGQRIRLGKEALEIIKQGGYIKAINGLIEAFDALCRAKPLVDA